MPAIAAVAIPAAAAVVGGVIQSRAAGRAAKAQQASTQAALDYEKENQRSRQARYDAAMEDYNKRYDAWVQQYYGGGAAPAASGGVRASSGASGGGGGGVPPYQSVGAHQSGNSIAELLMQMGQQQGQSAVNSGNIWGSAINSAGQGLGAAFGPKGPLAAKPKATINGQFQPVGLSQAETGFTPWQPTQTLEPSGGMPLGQSGGWNDWRNYLGTGAQ